ncbi:MAG: LPS export ABC transporter permease LptG [Ignavibacteriae bacterium HGW-Ignavibacteriae-3]|nr:MAG: LPS export ABC transporter permease LptG [Ignavibacteriae bacterium HGW-Ignavibacteriae-3]
MMKILDRYLVKQFLQTILFGLLAFTLLFVVIDLMENLGDFIDQNVPGRQILHYYIVFIPEMIRLMTPVAVLLASLFTAGKMANQNELTAIKASGVSLYRFMAPFIITSILISIFSVYFGGYLVPIANKQKVFIEQNYMKKGLVFFGNNIFFQDSKTRIVTISYYDVSQDQANQISIQEFDPNESTKLISRTDSYRMKYDSTNSSWIVFEGITRTFSDSTESIQKFNMKEFKDLNFKPSDVIQKQRKPEEMTLGELKNFSAEQLRTGNDPTSILIEYNSRIAFAFASMIVVLFGLPISANRRRGGLAIQFGINLLITFVYLVFMKVSQAFGKSGVMNPLATAWFANFIFLLAALYNIKRAQK